MLLGCQSTIYRRAHEVAEFANHDINLLELALKLTLKSKRQSIDGNNHIANEDQTQTDDELSKSYRKKNLNQKN